MGLFDKKDKTFKSNNKLVQIIISANLSIDEVENKLEELFLYRNVEELYYRAEGVTLVKFKDLKVRSPLEVENIKKQLYKEAGLEFER